MSEYTELVERAEFAATSAKNSAAQTKSDKDTVVSLYNEIKAIIDAGGGSGGGGSCKFYECAEVVDKQATSEVKAGITISGSATESVNGFYEPQGDTSDLSTAMWYNGRTYIYKCSGYDFWVISAYNTDTDPSNSYFYGEYKAAQPPWETSAWEVNVGSGSIVMTGSFEDIPESPAEKSWSGYEWLRNETTIEHPGTTYNKFKVTAEAASENAGVYTQIDKTVNDKPVFEHEAGNWFFCYIEPSDGFWVWMACSNPDGTGNMMLQAPSSTEPSDMMPWDYTDGWWRFDAGVPISNVTVELLDPIVTPGTTEVQAVYEKSTTLTEGLSWTSVKPKVGKSYTEDALVEAKLYEGYGYIPAGAPIEGLCAWYSLHEDASDSLGNKDGKVIGNIDFSNSCATNFGTDNYIELPNGITGASTEWTFGYMLKKEENGGYDWAMGSTLTWYDTGEWHSLDYEGSQWSAFGISSAAFDWRLVVVTNSPATGKWALYTDLQNNRTDSSPKSFALSQKVTLGVQVDSSGNASSPTPASTKIKNAFFYDRALSAEEYAAIYNSLLNEGEFN